MNKIAALALNTFRESIRDRIFYSLLAFAVIMLAFSLVLGNLPLWCAGCHFCWHQPGVQGDGEADHLRHPGASNLPLAVRAGQVWRFVPYPAGGSGGDDPVSAGPVLV